MMDKVLEAMGELKSGAENLILGISQQLPKDQLGEKALAVLLKTVELEQRYKQSVSIAGKNVECPKNLTSDIDAEIKKVQRKLHSWADAKKQNQINVRILNLYLELESKSEKQITVDEFRNAYDSDREFGINYPQMKAISPKNNCKVFEEENKIVSIWKPVRSYVDEYKNTVLKPQING